ncbi:MAG: hypothetical protein QXP36_09780 [Conexivisphaerales archaeon]
MALEKSTPSEKLQEKRIMQLESIYHEGVGENEVGIGGGRKIKFKFMGNFLGPIESENSMDDFSKARDVLIWEPKTEVKEL